MSMHNKPECNPPELVAALKAHGMEVDQPSMSADAFRSGWFAAQPGWTPPRCESCDCEFGGATCKELRLRTRTKS